MKRARADVWTAKWIGLLLLAQSLTGCWYAGCALLCIDERDDMPMVESFELLAPADGQSYSGAITIRVDVRTTGDDTPDIYARGSIAAGLPTDPVVWSAVGVSEQTWTPPWNEPVEITLDVSATVSGGDSMGETIRFQWSPQ